MAERSPDVLVSVVVPSFNVAPYVEASVRSIQAQTHRRLEILLIDDASTDETLDRLHALAAEDLRIRVICHGENLGLSAARNSGIDHCHGQYVMFVDSDDVIRPDLVARCLDAMSRAEIDFIVFDHEILNAAKAAPHRRTALPVDPSVYSPVPAEYFSLPYFAWLKFLNLSFLRDNGIRFEVGLAYEDHLFHWHIGLAANRVAFLREPLYGYRLRPASITSLTGETLLDKLKAQEAISTLLASSRRREELARIEKIQAVKGTWFVVRNIEGEHLRRAVTMMHQRGQTFAFHSGQPLKLDSVAGALQLAMIMPPRVAVVFLKVLRTALKRL